jgi:hypothetical protein
MIVFDLWKSVYAKMKIYWRYFSTNTLIGLRRIGKYLYTYIKKKNFISLNTVFLFPSIFLWENLSCPSEGKKIKQSCININIRIYLIYIYNHNLLTLCTPELSSNYIGIFFGASYTLLYFAKYILVFFFLKYDYTCIKLEILLL